VKLALGEPFHGTGQPPARAVPGDTGPATHDLRPHLEDIHRREAGRSTRKPRRAIREKKRECAGRFGKASRRRTTTSSSSRPKNASRRSTDFHIFTRSDESDRTASQSGVVLRADFSERGQRARDAVFRQSRDPGRQRIVGGRPLGRRSAASLTRRAGRLPDYKTFPYRGTRPLAAMTVRGGGQVPCMLDGGEGFSYSRVLKNGARDCGQRPGRPLRGDCRGEDPARLREGDGRRSSSGPR